MELLSISQYAKLKKITRQAVLIQIKQNRLPENVLANMVGNTWIIRII